MLKAADVAERVNLCTRTLWKWEACGRMPPAARNGRKCARWREDVINLWIACGLSMTRYAAAVADIQAQVRKAVPA
jgi:predicted DNA-binding transcriptional regulator AlpA